SEGEHRSAEKESAEGHTAKEKEKLRQEARNRFLLHKRMSPPFTREVTSVFCGLFRKKRKRLGKIKKI
ncbi:hypothetical protein, partial [Stomatobaculum longum]